MDDGIDGRLRAYREHGRWCIRLELPEWVIRDIRADWDRAKVSWNLPVLNIGGRTMLVGSLFQAPEYKPPEADER